MMTTFFFDLIYRFLFRIKVKYPIEQTTNHNQTDNNKKRKSTIVRHLGLFLLKLDDRQIFSLI